MPIVNFLTVQNVANLFQQATVVGITAIGMTFVILTANIDLSVGSMVAFWRSVDGNSHENRFAS